MDEAKQRAINAQVMMQQPFWHELVEFMSSLEAAAQNQVFAAQHADPLVLKGLHQKWVAVHSTVSQILRFPQAAVEGGG
jgi:hypothetical protein